MIEKKNSKKTFEGHELRKTRFHRINLPSNSMGKNTMMSLKSYVSTRYG